MKVVIVKTLRKPCYVFIKEMLLVDKLNGEKLLSLKALAFVYIGCTRKTRIIDVVYNASNNELVRTKTLVKNCIVLIDSLPYRQWYEAHYATPLGRKKGAKLVCWEIH